MAFGYERNENGNITAENSTRYRYDDLNRLTTWYDPATDATTTYTYDAVYNLTSAVRNGVTLKKFAFDAAERISNVGYAHDANGNMTSDGSRAYAYDELNRLTSVTGTSGATIARYTYDHANRRTSATDASGATTYFHYDGAGANVIAETDGEGHTIATYAWAGGSPISMTRGGATFYYHTNAHGDVLALTDASGDVVASYTYDPWGMPTGATGAVENPYRYAGYRYDSPTGLYYLLNRYYSPESCRFITRDLLPGDTMQPATMNHYAYCMGDPVNRVDPSGLLSQATCDKMKTELWTDTVMLATAAAVILTVIAVVRFGPVVLAALAPLSAAAGPVINKLMTLAPRARAALGSLAGRGGAASVRLGQAGESAVRGAYNIGPKVRITVNGRVRIPDGLTSTRLSEVKNVASQSYTLQLRDDVAFAQSTGRQVDLYLRPTTQISGPLQRAIADPNVPLNLRTIP